MYYCSKSLYIRFTRFLFLGTYNLGDMYLMTHSLTCKVLTNIPSQPLFGGHYNLNRIINSRALGKNERKPVQEGHVKDIGSRMGVQSYKEQGCEGHGHVQGQRQEVGNIRGASLQPSGARIY